MNDGNNRQRQLEQTVSKIRQNDKEILDILLQTPEITPTRNFDYVKSKELCPWPKAKELNDIDESQLSGPLVYVGREIAKVKRIKIINAKQVRKLLVDQSNATVINQSLCVHSWLNNLPPIIVIRCNDDPNYDYILVLGFTRQQEMDNLGWDECLVDVIEASPLVQRELGIDTNLHIGKGGKSNTKESIWNQALTAVGIGELEDDDEVVKEWILKRARDKRNPESIFDEYKLRRPRTGVMQTFHTDDNDNPNSICEYARNNNLPYHGDANSNHGIGIITKSPQSKTQWKIIDEMILKYPNSEDIIYGMWIEKPNQNTLEQDRINQIVSARKALKKKAEAHLTINKRVKERGGDTTSADDIIKYGYRVSFKHVGQDTSSDYHKGGDPKEQGWVD